MSMFNDIDRTKKGNDEMCISNSEEVKAYAKKFSQGHWTFFGPLEMKRSGIGKQRTLLKESEIQLRLRWYSDSRKQVTQSAQVPVH